MNVHRTQIFAHANLVNLGAVWVNMSTLLKLHGSGFFWKICRKILIQVSLYKILKYSNSMKKKNQHFHTQRLNTGVDKYLPLFYLSCLIHLLYYIFMYYEFVFLVHRHTLWILHCSSPIPALIHLSLFSSCIESYPDFFFSSPKKCFWFSFHLQKERDKSIEVEDCTCQFSWKYLPLPFLSCLPHLSNLTCLPFFYHMESGNKWRQYHWMTNVEGYHVLKQCTMQDSRAIVCTEWIQSTDFGW